MDSVKPSSRKIALLLPALVAGGLFCGISLGIVLTHGLNAQASAPSSYSTPLYMNTAAKRTTKHEKAITSAIAVADPAANYLRNSESVTPDSTQWLGFMNHLQLERPNWAWSRHDLNTKHVPFNDVFGTNPKASNSSEAIATHQVAEEQVPASIKKQRLVVALDPGHGGTDPGSKAHNGLLEKELTLDMAKRVELFLSEIDNVDVVMTRSTDKGMSRQSRVNRIKAVGADVVVSLHFNHLPQTNINLVESFFADRHNIIESLEKQNRSPSAVNLDFTGASADLAGIMHKKVFNEVASVNDSVVDAGVKRDTLFVLTRSFTPGVLLELTCISNPAEAERLATTSYRNQLAAAIADGLRDYLMRQHADQFGELLAKLDL